MPREKTSRVKAGLSMYETRTKLVRKGTTGYAVMKGHYDILYPNLEEECVFLADAIIKKMPWPTQRELIAVSVSRGLVQCSEENYKNQIVWIKPEDIELY
jgi:hypothetical protein